MKTDKNNRLYYIIWNDIVLSFYKAFWNVDFITPADVYADKKKKKKKLTDKIFKRIGWLFIFVREYTPTIKTLRSRWNFASLHFVCGHVNKIHLSPLRKQYYRYFLFCTAEKSRTIEYSIVPGVQLLGKGIKLLRSNPKSYNFPFVLPSHGTHLDYGYKYRS